MIGIGGSYTGVKAILDFVEPDSTKHLVKIHFLNSVSSTHVSKTLKQLSKLKSWATVVISKSGTTLESSVNFRLVRQALYDQFDKQANQRIVAITDPQKGVLHDLCVEHGYEMLPILGDIGGRFSTLTPVGLFPALLAGIDIKDLLAGAKLAHHELTNCDPLKNTAYLYAAYRHYLYTKAKKDVEVLITYEDYLEMTCLQHRQLFGESEGKDHNSLFPTYSVFTTDLHSMGQLYQEGKQIFFETVLKIQNPHQDTKVNKSSFNNDDGLDYLVNKSLHEINELACQATTKAHADAGVNIIQIELDDSSAVTFGYLYY